MALRDKLHTKSQPFLEPGETTQAVFLGQTGPSPYWSLLTYLVFFAVKMHAFVVTDRRILILRSGFWVPTNVHSVAYVLPRETRLGPLTGLWATMEHAGQKFRVHKRFHKDVSAADALLDAGPGGFAQPQALGPPAPAPPPSPSAQPPGWYGDPWDEGGLRYWDGSAWTGHVRAG